MTPDPSLIALFFSDLHRTVKLLKGGSLASEQLVILHQGALILGWGRVSDLAKVLSLDQTSTELLELLFVLEKMPPKADSYHQWAHIAEGKINPPTKLILPAKIHSSRHASGQGDLSLYELFSEELSNQIDTLSSALLGLESSLERSLDQPANLREYFDALMRAAHGLKGAARAVGLHPLVPLLHQMETFLEAANTQRLKKYFFETLFKCVDLLTLLHQTHNAAWNVFLNEQEATIATLIGQLQELHPFLDKSPLNASISSPPSIEVIPKNILEDIRISASRLNSIIGLSAEMVVFSQNFNASLKDWSGLKRKYESGISYLAQVREQLTLFSNDPHLVAMATSLEFTMAQFLCAQQDMTSSIADGEQFSRQMGLLSERLYRTTVGSRMRPFRDGVRSFPRMMRDLGQELGKEIIFVISGENTDVDREILQKLEIPLTHLLRNSLVHAIEPPEVRHEAGKNRSGKIKLEAFHQGGMLHILIADDGAGIDCQRIKEKIIQQKLGSTQIVNNLSESELFQFLFLPGFSTAKNVTELAGRGVGLDLVKKMINEYHGIISIQSEKGKGTTFHLQLPVTLSFMKCLLVEIQGEPYALALCRIERLVKVEANQIESITSQQYVNLNDQKKIPLFYSGQLLNLEVAPKQSAIYDVILLKEGTQSYGMIVDRILKQLELMVSPLDTRLGKIPGIHAGSISQEGDPILILDTEDLLIFLQRAALKNNQEYPPTIFPTEENPEKYSGFFPGSYKILVVEDSPTVRELERRLLLSYGYKVDTATDGMDGWNYATHYKYDLIISDIDMPRMNGMELLQKIREYAPTKDLPFIIVSYKDGKEDKSRAFALGANAYLPKSSFENQLLLQEVQKLLQDSSSPKI